MNIITGYKGDPHVTAQQLRDTNRSAFGSGIYIADLPTGKFTATIVSANEIRIGAGLLIAQGCTAEIPYGTTESMTIANGTQGMKRWDIIAARYTKNTGTGVENMSLIVLQGTPSSGNPSAPAYTTGDIVAGITTRDFPLYDVMLNGLSIESVTRNTSVQILSGLEEVWSQIAGIVGEFFNVRLMRRTYPFTISYEAGTPGTRGARVTLTADYKADMQYNDLQIVGMYVDGFTASTNMQIELHTNGTIIYATAYRATNAAASDVTGNAVVTFMHAATS